MIKVDNISFQYEENSPPVLNGLSLEIPAGQWLAVIGPNGSGKSTLARHLNGLLLPQQGSVEVEGYRTDDPDQLWYAREQVAFVFQNPDNQLVATSVEDDIVFGPENLGLSREEICVRLEMALEITGLQEKRQKMPHLLSGGEKQRVAIAGALAMRSRYLVLDEPTSMLDPQLRQSVVATLRQLHTELGMGVIYVTNIMEEALLAERVIVLEGGQIVKDGPPSEIFADHQWLLARQLDMPPACHIASMLAESGYPQLTGSLSLEELLERLRELRPADFAVAPTAATGSTGSTPPVGPAESAGEAAIELSGVDYTYQPGSVTAAQALFGVDLRIQRGELLALIGHSGSGKSTLAQLVTGLMPPGAGTLVVHGKNSQDLPKGAIFGDVGLVFQYPEQQLFGENIFEEVAFGPRNLGLIEEKVPGAVRQALKDVGLDPEIFWERSPFALSGGQKRRVCIASVLAMGAKTLILDEPTAGLDEGGRQWMLELVRRLNKQGKTILWISHNMEEVAELARRIVVLAQGRVIADGTPVEVFAAAEELAALGLDIPVAAKLVRRLQAEGVPLPGRAVTVPEAYQELLTWLGGERHDA